MFGKHKTCESIPVDVQPVGIDLFDDELENQTSIYIRYEDGTRFPARTVSDDSPNRDEVLSAWAARGSVYDYRGHHA